MTPLDYACSYFDVPTNFACKAQPGELCNWPDGRGGRRESSQCHSDRVDAFRAMDCGPGTVPDAEDFEQAVDKELSAASETASESV